MSQRSVGSISVSFGLVSIPVKLFSATNETRGIKFNLLGPKGDRLRQQYVDPQGVVVARADMVKGYEYAKDHFVMFTPAEIKAMDEEGSHVSDILEFVPADSVDPLFFDKPYFLAPDIGGLKPYALLATALRETDRVAIGRWASRGKQKVVMIRATEDGLVMQQLLYATEVRSFKDLAVAPAEIKDIELKLAKQLIEAQSAEAFDPKVYTDEVAARIEAAVQKKIEGQDFSVSAPAAEKATNVIDMAEALLASIAKKGKRTVPPSASQKQKPVALAKRAKKAVRS